MSMKHASEIFPDALQKLIEMGEEARKKRKANDRETIRVKRKEKRARARQLTFNLNTK